MAKILTVRTAFSAPERAEDLTAALAEIPRIHVTSWADLEPAGEADVVLSDGEPADHVTPHLLIGSGMIGGNVRGVLPQSASAELIAAALRVIAAGFVLAPGPAETAPAEKSPIRFTSRELQVLALLADGAPNKVIARKLDISVHTAKFHVAALIAKLGAKNRTEATSIAMREGLALF